MQISQSSIMESRTYKSVISGKVMYENIVTDKYHFYVKSDEAIIHRLYTTDFYNIKYSPDSMISSTLLRMAKNTLPLDFNYLANVCKIHCIEMNKMTMM